MDIERLKEWANTQNIGTANMSYHKAQEHVLKIINESNQSATSEDVAEAIEWLESEYIDDFEGYPETCEKLNRMVDLAIKALRQYQPKGE